MALDISLRRSGVARPLLPSALVSNECFNKAVFILDLSERSRQRDLTVLTDNKICSIMSY